MKIYIEQNIISALHRKKLLSSDVICWQVFPSFSLVGISLSNQLLVVKKLVSKLGVRALDGGLRKNKIFRLLGGNY
jgi:hypothetical protein